MADEKAVDVKASLEAKKAELAAKREELSEWLKTNKLKKGTDYSEDEKFGKTFRIKTKAIKLLQAERDKLAGEAKDKTPKVVKLREAKYPYPADATSDDKKKFRQLMRTRAKYAGVDVNAYLSNPEKYAAAIAEREAKKSESKVESGKKLAAARAAKLAKADVEPAPVKKGTKVVKEEAKVVPLAKKKKVPAPTLEEED